MLWLLNAWKALPTVGKIAVGASAAAGTYYLIDKAYDKYELNRRLKLQKESIYKVPAGKKVILVNGKVGTQQTNLYNIANEIYDAFYNYYGGEDEDRAILAFRRTPVLAIPQLEKTYLELSGKNLRDDMQKFLKETEYIKVKFFFK